MTSLPSPQEAALSARWLTDQSQSPPDMQLLPWQSAFAEWLSSQPDRPPTQAQCRIASSLCKQPVSHRVLNKVKRSPAFQKYYVALQADALRRARVMLEHHYTEGVEAHLGGLRMALAEEDYKAIPAFTVPILDRVAPKKETAVAATLVNVVLTTKQQALISDEAPEVSYEVLEPPAE